MAVWRTVFKIKFYNRHPTNLGSDIICVYTIGYGYSQSNFLCTIQHLAEVGRLETPAIILTVELTPLFCTPL